MLETVNGPDYENLKSVNIFKSLAENEKYLKSLFEKCSDIMFRKITPSNSDINMLIVYVDELTNIEFLENSVLSPIYAYINSSKSSNSADMYYFKSNILPVAEINEHNTFDTVILELLSGKTLLFLDTFSSAFSVNSEDAKERAITPPELEQTTRGPRTSFIESYKTNLALIRKSIKDPNLCIETVPVGRRNKTSMEIVYIKGIIRDDIPQKMKKKLESIDIDGVMGSGQLEQFIEKNKWTVLPQMFATERVDRVIGNILEGRAVIISDCSPFALIFPTTLKLFLNSTDDYYQRPIISTLLRFIRYISFFISISFVSLYVALTAYQPGMLPTPLALSITGSRVGLPFPVIMEILLMELALYTIQEAAIRLPKAMGPTVGIVGALIIGQASVQAGIVSPIIVIVVAMSAITSFALPNYTFSLGCIVLRLFMVFMASVLGLYGVVMGWIYIAIHLASLDNFGIRYLSDYSPYDMTNFMDTIIRISETYIYKRPTNLETKDAIKHHKSEADDMKDGW